jgi:hypothetical protein
MHEDAYAIIRSNMVTRIPPKHNAYGFGLLALVMLLLVIGVLAGIVSIVHNKSGTHLKVSNGCKDTDIAVQPVALDSLSSPLSLQAKVTMGAQPVSKERVTFRIVGHDGQRRALMDTLGYATTDADGVATLQKSAGIADVSITFGKGGVLTGYRAEFDGNGTTDRVKDKSIPFYCGSNATTTFSHSLTVQSVSL